MEEEILATIDKKLDAIVRLLARGCVEGKNKTEQITTLSALGLDINLIAQVVDTTPATVHARLSEARRKGKVEGRKATKKVKPNE